MGGADGVMPGIRREDVRPPAARSFVTGVPAFIGFLPTVAAGSGPAGGSATPVPVMLTGTIRGDGPASGSLLEAAVDGFFANGGQLCVVVRVPLDDDPLAAFRAAVTVLDGVDDIDLLCLPDLAASAAPGAELVATQLAVLEHCAARGDRFAILDALPGADVTGVLGQVAALSGDSGAYGALYHPWLLIGGPAGPRAVPPCGHLAGTYAAFDREAGVHRAPANRALADVLDVAIDLTEAEADRLYTAGANPLLPVPGRGIRARGARTLATAPQWRAIPARRLVSSLTRWMERFLASAVHEPNDIRLWVRIMRELTAALEGLHAAGALAGTTAAESFYVKCDHETNPPGVVSAGMVVTEVGVALVAPAEFIVVRLVHGAGESTFNAA